MLKLIESYSEAMDYARYLMSHADLSDYQVGICGSFVDGSNKKSSTIDIVLARKRDAVGEVLDPDVPVGLRSVVTDLENQSALVYYTRPRVLWYDILEEENKKVSSGLADDYPTPFKTLNESLRWVDEDVSVKTDSADDVIPDPVVSKVEDYVEGEFGAPVEDPDAYVEGEFGGTPVDSNSMFETLNPEEQAALNDVAGGDENA